MCIRFSRSQDDVDILSYMSNIVGNAAVAVVGGTAVAAIAYVALNALGYEAITAGALAIVVPYLPLAVTAAVATYGLVPLVAGVVAGAALLALVLYLGSNKSHRKIESDFDSDSDSEELI
jgi:hypothetical protein